MHSSKPATEPHYKNMSFSCHYSDCNNHVLVLGCDYYCNNQELPFFWKSIRYETSHCKGRVTAVGRSAEQAADILDDSWPS